MAGKRKHRSFFTIICLVLCAVFVFSMPVTVFGQAVEDEMSVSATAPQIDTPVEEPQETKPEETQPEETAEPQETPVEPQETTAEPQETPAELRESEQDAPHDAPASYGATDAQSADILEAAWARTGTLSSLVEVGLNDSLDISVAPGSIGTGDAAEYKFVVTYFNDEAAGEETGFKVVNSGKFIPGPPEGVKQTLVYEIEPGSIAAASSIGFQADPKKVYPNEKMQVLVQLFRDNEEIDRKTAYMETFFLTAGIVDRVGLKDPLSITEGASGAPYEAGFSISSLKTAGITTNGGVWGNYFATSYVDFDNVRTTLDFSDVSITAGEYTHTYKEWQDPAVYAGHGMTQPPVTFYRDAAGTDRITPENPEIFYEQSGKDRNADYNPLYYPFYIVTTEEFTGSGTKIDFQDMGVSRSMEINGHRYSFEERKGAIADFADFNDRNVPLVNVKQPAGMVIKPAAGGEATVVMRAAVGTASAPYLQYNSAQYAGSGAKTEHLYLQELFKLEITKPGEPQDVELTLDIPENTKVTKLRLPPLGGNSKYESVEVNGATLAAPVDGNYATLDIPGHDFGRELKVRINGLQSIQSSSGRPVEYPKNILQFAGVTNTAVSPGGTAKFELKSAVTGEGGTVTLKGTRTASATVTDQYWVDVYTESTTIAFSEPNSTANPVSTIEKGEPFYLTMQFFPSHYPYSSTLRVDADDPVNTTLLPNPVVYFVLPEGMEADLTGVQIFKNTTGGRGFKLLGDDPENLNFTAKSLGKNGGGREVMEIKLHGKNEDDSVWIEGYYASRLRVSITVTVPPEADISHVEMNANDALVGTWGGSGVRTFMSGAGGTSISTAGIIPAGAALSGGYAVRSNNERKTSITLTSSKNAQVFAAVRTDAEKGKYQSYSSNIPGSMPQVRAGSRNEQFLVQIYNGINTELSNVEAYFLLPAANTQEDGKWRTALTGQPVFAAEAGTSYKVYYTTQELMESGKQGWTLDELAALGTWEEAAGGRIPEEDIGKVSGFRFVFETLGNREQFKMTADFGVPAVKQGTKPDYGAMAIGQTLFDFSDEMKGENANTAAVRLRRSDPPIVREPEGAGEKEILPETEADMLGPASQIPRWDEAIAYDDVTDVAIESVKIEFTPEGGQSAVIAEFNGTDFEEEDYSPDGKVPGLGTDYAKGTKSKINFAGKQASDYVNTSKAGTYVITYVSEPDADGQATTAVRKISIVRPDNDLSAAGAEVELFRGDTAPDGFADWETYLRSRISITDGTGSEKRGQAIAAMNGFDPNAPGRYTVAFTYTNPYGHSATADVAVLVKYKGVVSGTFTANGEGVGGIRINTHGTDGAPGRTAADGTFRFGLEASREKPEEKDYTLELERETIPTGIKDVQDEQVKVSGTGGAGNLDPIHNLEMEPISITVGFDRGAAQRTESVALYVNGEQAMTQRVTGAGDYLFQPQANGGWFRPEAGDYEVIVTPKEGMAADIDRMGDLQKGSGDAFVSGPLALANEDIVLNATSGAPPEPTETPSAGPTETPATESPSAGPTEAPPAGNPAASPTGAPPTGNPTAAPSADAAAQAEASGETDNRKNGEEAAGVSKRQEVNAPTPEGQAQEEAFIVSEDSKIPMAGAEASGQREMENWSLADLLLMLAGAALAVLNIVRLCVKKKRRQPQKHKALLITGILAGAVAPVLFLVTQDMTSQMTIFDRWTWLFGLLAILPGITLWLRRKKEAKE